MTTKTLVARHALLLAVVALGTACASVKAFQAERQYVRDQTAKHVYQRPVAELLPEVRKLLFEKGFRTKDTSSEAAGSVETEEKKDGDSKVKYLVLTSQAQGGGYKVEFTKVSTGLLGPTSERDLDLENVFMRRVDFDSAAQIDKEASVEGRKVKSAS
jgi:hypothetical protein